MTGAGRHPRPRRTGATILREGLNADPTRYVHATPMLRADPVARGAIYTCPKHQADPPGRPRQRPDRPRGAAGDFVDVSLDTGSIAVALDCHVWSNDSVRVTAGKVSASTVDLAAAPLAVQVTKRRIP